MCGRLIGALLEEAEEGQEGPRVEGRGSRVEGRLPSDLLAELRALRSLLGTQTVSAGYFWGDLRPLILQAHLRLANLVSPLTREELKPQSGLTAAVAVEEGPVGGGEFRAPPSAVAILSQGMLWEVVGVGGGHLLDGGPAGLAETLRTLDKASIAHTGAGMNSKEARKPAIVEFGNGEEGERAAVFSFAAQPHAPTADSSGPTFNFLDPEDYQITLGQLKMDIAAVRRGEGTEGSEGQGQGVGVVFVSVHWPFPPSSSAPTPQIRTLSHAIIDSGADLVLGHSNHAFLGVEIYQGKPILYGVGDGADFGLGGSEGQAQAQAQSFLALAHWSPATRCFTQISLLPTRVWMLQRQLSRSAEEVAEQTERLEAHCHALGASTSRRTLPFRPYLSEIIIPVAKP